MILSVQNSFAQKTIYFFKQPLLHKLPLFCKTLFSNEICYEHWKQEYRAKETKIKPIGTHKPKSLTLLKFNHT